MADTKLKMLRVLDILLETDPDHPLTTAQIADQLSLFGLSAERKAINRDIHVLQQAGYDIRPCPDNKRGFYLASRTFATWELKVLIDAIVSAKFLTEAETRSIAAKLMAQDSSANAQLLTRVTPVNTHIKQNNPLIKETIGALLTAIRQQRKVEFQYQSTNHEMKKELRKGGYCYRINPYALTWKDEHYYLICNLDKYDNLGYYRLDRIVNLRILDEPVKDAVALLGENPAHRIDDYVATAIYCHTGEKINLRLLCQYGLEDEICDYFGSDHYHSQLPDGFECHIRVMHSQGLIYWLMQHGSKVKVLAPEAVRDELIASLKATLAQY
ncbi:helix-turn-helix transcriptional regulator [Acetobacterium malicum]|uniref:helix-turn-helix transcriptional regulator n=1 Tax=Acetobacterium malicum TaxID=52692 RepID=UPI003593683E